MAQKAITEISLVLMNSSLQLSNIKTILSKENNKDLDYFNEW